MSPRETPFSDAPTPALSTVDRFADALIDPKKATPEDLKGPNGKAADKRFAVYRNNVVVSLVDALAATFPAVQRIVGEQFFRAMARVYALETPPTSPLMAEYGHGFPAFLERFEHVAELPYLPDVARIERAWLDVYHAADAPPLDPSILGSIAPERMAQVRFIVHPAARVIQSAYAAVSITALNRSEADCGALDVNVAEDALLTRPHLEVTLRRLPPGGAVFLQALTEGATLGEAATVGANSSPDFDLPANIGGVLSAGAFTEIELEGE